MAIGQRVAELSRPATATVEQPARPLGRASAFLALVVAGVLSLVPGAVPAPGPTAQGSLAAQESERTVGGGFHFHGYEFDDGLGSQAATLLMLPIAFHTPVTENLDLDLYTAWARGQVQSSGQILSLTGFTDTQVRAAYDPAPWALVTLSANLPTGNSTHDAEEAIVASVLATDLLGFREANWGTGFGITPGVATARQIGPWNVGLGLSYRMAGEFEPEAGSALTYEPGDEMRVRLGIDRNVGEDGKITGGVTLQNFATDELSGRNLFQAGSRFRVDGSYAFRTGASTWTVFGINSWRDRGDLSLTLLDQTGTEVGDTLVHTESQNIAQIGVAGSIPVGSIYRIRPTVDLQVQSRNGPGSGWLVGAGGDFPLRLFGALDVFPQAKLLAGSVEGGSGESVAVIGGEFGGTIRWQP